MYEIILRKLLTACICVWLFQVSIYFCRHTSSRLISTSTFFLCIHKHCHRPIVPIQFLFSFTSQLIKHNINFEFLPKQCVVYSWNNDILILLQREALFPCLPFVNLLIGLVSSFLLLILVNQKQLFSQFRSMYVSRLNSQLVGWRQNIMTLAPDFGKKSHFFESFLKISKKNCFIFEISRQIVLLFWKTLKLDSAKLEKNNITARWGSAIPHPPHIAYLVLLTKRNRKRLSCFRNTIKAINS